MLFSNRLAEGSNRTFRSSILADGPEISPTEIVLFALGFYLGII
ncbi:unnamed protein product [Acidithrix sp. C25]|nr:unnamed protein product [Acidithrix sp. C25]